MLKVEPQKTVRTAFAGTSPEGLSCLEFLADNPRLDLQVVLTQPDKPTGRKRELTPTPIKSRAQELGIDVLTPMADLDYQAVLDKYRPELVVVIAYGNFLPRFFVDHPKFKCLNIHYSLLPELRGAIPIQAAILHGLTKTGVTLQVMEETMDTGPIIAQEEIQIDPRETTPGLKEKAIPLGKEILERNIAGWIYGEIKPVEQDHSKATYCYVKDMAKDKAEINWQNMEPDIIDRMIRAFLPWPVVWTVLPNGKRLKIYEAEIVETQADKPPGTFFIGDNYVLISTKQARKALKLLSVQQEGKAQMDGRQFAQGAANFVS